MLMANSETGLANELNLKKLLEHAHIGVVIHNWDTSVVYANPTALRLMRLSYEQVLGKTAFDPSWHFVDESGKILTVEEYPVNKVKNNNIRLENEIIGAIDGANTKISWFMVNAYMEDSGNNETSFIVVTFNDITDTKQLFSFSDIVTNTQDIVIVTEATPLENPIGPKIVYVNKAFEQLTGYKFDDVIGETPRMLQGALTDKLSTQRIKEALNNKRPITETLLNYDCSGRPYWVEMNIMPLTNKYGEVTHFAAIERDVSERKFHLEQLKSKNEDLKALKVTLEKRVEERTNELMSAKVMLEQIAFIDQLTNIPNRRYFIDQATKVIYAAQRQNSPIAFGFIDVDNFKKINDEYGHAVGDKVLKVISSCFDATFRKEDAYCRYGGEEFAFAVIIKASEDTENLANRLLKTVRDAKVIVDDVEIRFTISLGIKIKQATVDTDFELELKDADDAMYQAKNEGKDRFVIIES